MAAACDMLPPVRGTIARGATLKDHVWFRVGGPAEILFRPADIEDLCDFLAARPAGLNVSVIGVGSNLLVRDGGIAGVVVRLSSAFGKIEIDGMKVRAGAAALDGAVARAAADAGIAGLEFLRGVPGGADRRWFSLPAAEPWLADAPTEWLWPPRMHLHGRVSTRRASERPASPCEAYSIAETITAADDAGTGSGAISSRPSASAACCVTTSHVCDSSLCTACRARATATAAWTHRAGGPTVSVQHAHIPTAECPGTDLQRRNERLLGLQLLEGLLHELLHGLNASVQDRDLGVHGKVRIWSARHGCGPPTVVTLSAASACACHERALPMGGRTWRPQSEPLMELVDPAAVRGVHGLHSCGVPTAEFWQAEQWSLGRQRNGQSPGRQSNESLGRQRNDSAANKQSNDSAANKQSNDSAANNHTNRRNRTRVTVKKKKTVGVRQESDSYLNVAAILRRSGGRRRDGVTA